MPNGFDWPQGASSWSQLTVNVKATSAAASKATMAAAIRSDGISSMCCSIP